MLELTKELKMQNVYAWLVEHNIIVFLLALFAILAVLTNGQQRAAFLEDRLKLGDEKLLEANALSLSLTREIAELKVQLVKARYEGKA